MGEPAFGENIGAHIHWFKILVDVRDDPLHFPAKGHVETGATPSQGIVTPDASADLEVILQILDLLVRQREILVPGEENKGRLLSSRSGPPMFSGVGITVPVILP